MGRKASNLIKAVTATCNCRVLGTSKLCTCESLGPKKTQQRLIEWYVVNRTRVGCLLKLIIRDFTTPIAIYRHRNSLTVEFLVQKQQQQQILG